jgi:hypothetical protein
MTAHAVIIIEVTSYMCILVYMMNTDRKIANTDMKIVIFLSVLG